MEEAIHRATGIQQVSDKTDGELVPSRPNNERLDGVLSYRELDWQQQDCMIEVRSE